MVLARHGAGGLVLAQIGLYVLFMVRVWKSPNRPLVAGVFVSGYASGCGMETGAGAAVDCVGILGRCSGAAPALLHAFALLFRHVADCKSRTTAVLQMSFLEWVGSLILVLSATGLACSFTGDRYEQQRAG